MSKYTELERAKYAAFLYLDKRMLTHHQMVEKLKKKEYSQETIEKVMEYLQELGYINDIDYATRYIKDAVNIKRHGKYRIKMDLRAKGIPTELTEKLFEEINPDTEDVLSDLISIKCKNLDLKNPKDKNRLIGFLLRRGFSFAEIYDKLNKVGSDTDE